MTIFLCGFMGCGKTTAGKIAAKKLGFAYEDTDELIVRKEGMTIPEIFTRKGEAYFRETEAEIVKSLCGKNIVVSCGGGAMLNADTARAAGECGMVIFINTPFELCYERIKDDRNRPIAASSTMDELLERFNSRYTVYSKNSSVMIDGTGSPIEIAERIAEAVKRGKKC